MLPLALGTTLDEAEKQLIVRTLEVLGGNKQKTARLLGISRRCLYNKLARYGTGEVTLPSDPDRPRRGHNES